MTPKHPNTSDSAEPQPGFDVVTVETDFHFSFGALCRACGVHAAPLRALVDEGVLVPRVPEGAREPQAPQGDGPDNWWFDGTALRTARLALRLDADLQLGPAGTALVLDLLAENAALRACLQRAGLGFEP